MSQATLTDAYLACVLGVLGGSVGYAFGRLWREHRRR